MGRRRFDNKLRCHPGTRVAVIRDPSLLSRLRRDGSRVSLRSPGMTAISWQRSLSKDHITMPLDTAAATDRLMRLLAVQGVTGEEAAIGREIATALKEAGVPASAIYLDDANTRIPVPTETGNLIVHLPGQGKLHNQPRIMFMTHMDTVPLCAGAKPAIKGRKIVNTAKTALGGDNRTGCGVLVTLAAELARGKLGHPPLTLLFCVREESGLWGARFVDKADLGKPVMAFNYDGGSAANVGVGAG